MGCGYIRLGPSVKPKPSELLLTAFCSLRRARCCCSADFGPQVSYDGNPVEYTETDEPNRLLWTTDVYMQLTLDRQDTHMFQAAMTSEIDAKAMLHLCRPYTQPYNFQANTIQNLYFHCSLVPSQNQSHGKLQVAFTMTQKQASRCHLNPSRRDGISYPSRRKRLPP